jgi:hypothetical protein
MSKLLEPIIFDARGIVAEPPKPRSGEGDGADSPTARREAARRLAQKKSSNNKGF